MFYIILIICFKLHVLVGHFNYRPMSWKAFHLFCPFYITIIIYITFYFTLFILFYCFNFSVFSSSVSSWGPTTLGAAFGPLMGTLSCGPLWPGWLEDSGPWCGASSARVGTVSVVVGREPSQCGRPPRWLFPCLRSGCPAVSLSDRCSGSELVCLCVSGYLWGLVCFIIVVFSHFVLLLKYKRCHINKIWFDCQC